MRRPPFSGQSTLRRLLTAALLAGFGLALLAACGGLSVDDEAVTDFSAEVEAIEEALTATENVVEPETVVTDEPDADDAEVEGEAVDDAADAESDAMPEVELVSWDGSFESTIQPIVEQKCASCHFAGGPGSLHWQLDTAQDLVDTHLYVAGIVETGAMPPWIAGGDSPAFHNDRSLRADQVQAIIDWSADGAPLDVAPETALEPTNGLLRLDDPTDTVTQVSYTGPVDQTDDYRCQLYELDLPEGGWITGFEFLPDNEEVVHHMIGYLIEGENTAERAKEKDGADGRPGWPCYGTTGLGVGQLIVGWAPGQEPNETPDGWGIPIPENASIVGQIHYHYDQAPEADASAFAVRTAPPEANLKDINIDILAAPVEIPCSTEESGPLCDRDAAYEAAIDKYGVEGVRSDIFNSVCGVDVEDFAHMTDGKAWADCTFPAPSGDLVSVLGHMHEIGTTFRMVLNPGRPDEQVLLDIPEWDFDWQYQYDPVPEVTFKTGDELMIECGWDRSLIKPGVEPAYILWADGTNDEMCFATVTTLEP